MSFATDINTNDKLYGNLKRYLSFEYIQVKPRTSYATEFIFFPDVIMKPFKGGRWRWAARVPGTLLSRAHTGARQLDLFQPWHFLAILTPLVIVSLAIVASRRVDRFRKHHHNGHQSGSTAQSRRQLPAGLQEREHDAAAPHHPAEGQRQLQGWLRPEESHQVKTEIITTE